MSMGITNIMNSGSSMPTVTMRFCVSFASTVRRGGAVGFCIAPMAEAGGICAIRPMKPFSSGRSDSGTTVEPAALTAASSRSWPGVGF